jgi:hypothetical protein
MGHRRRNPAAGWFAHFMLAAGLLAAACSGAGSPGSSAAAKVPEQGLVVSGVIADRLGGQGLEGVEVYLRSDGGEEQLVATSEQGGVYISEPVPVRQGADLEVRAHGPARSFYPSVVKARMDQAADLWQVDFVQAWPVSLWARAAERVAGRPADQQLVNRQLRPDGGAGTPMKDVPLYYQVEGEAKVLLGLTDAKGELFPASVWLPVGAQVSMWPEVEGFQFSPAECRWQHEPPLESLGALFVADPQDQPGDSRGISCDRVP